MMLFLKALVIGLSIGCGLYALAEVWQAMR